MKSVFKTMKCFGLLAATLMLLSANSARFNPQSLPNLLTGTFSNGQGVTVVKLSAESKVLNVQITEKLKNGRTVVISRDIEGEIIVSNGMAWVGLSLKINLKNGLAEKI